MAPHHDNAMKEGLSRAYVRAVAVRAGCRYKDVLEYDIGKDAEIDYIDWIDGKPQDTSLQLRLQIKATGQESNHTPEDVIFDLEVAHYRKLIAPSPGVPIVLIGFDMPYDVARWLDTARDGLVLRNCAYWKHLESEPDVSNDAKVRVKIPRSQQFDIEAVQGALRLIASKEDAVSDQRRAAQRRRKGRELPIVGRRPSP